MEQEQTSSDMSAFLWGKNNHGQLGLGDVVSNNEGVTVPTQIDVGNISWTQIECGEWYTVALSRNGEVFTWGCGGFGQLGHGDCKNRNKPTKVESLSGEKIVKVACGGHHTTALTATGHAKRGYGNCGQLGHIGNYMFNYPKRIEALNKEIIVDVACGFVSTVVFTASGMAYFFGSNANKEWIRTPSLHNGINGKKVISISMGIAFIGGYEFVGGFVTEAGELYTWGFGGHRCLGHGDSLDQPRPKLVEALSGEVCKQVACSGHCTAVVTESGRVYECGGHSRIEDGSGKTTKNVLPILVQELETIDIKEVRCYASFAMALSRTGYVYTWGCFGDERTVGSPSRLVEGLGEHNVLHISCSFGNCAVLVDPSPCPIRQAQKAQFNSKELSDVTFMVDDHPFYGNIDILSRKSQYFKAMFRSNMRESIEGVVVVPDVSRVVFLKLLEYLCLDDYVFDDLDERSKDELGVLADMYMLDGLKKLLCYKD